MKQNLVFILILSVLISGCNSEANDLQKSNLKGNIWKVQETSFEGKEKFGEYQVGDKNYWGHWLYIFNKNGNLVETKQLDNKGNIENHTEYTYDDNNICIKLETYEGDKLLSKQVNTIDNKKVSEVKIFDKDGNITDIYKYDYSGNVISSGSFFNKNGKPTGTFKNEISNGLLTKHTARDSIDKISYEIIYKRNAEGDVVEQVIKSIKDSSEYKHSFQYEYDSKKNWTKQYQFNKEGKIENIVVRNIVYYDDSDKIRSDKDFIGIWFVVDDYSWIEFGTDKKYDTGNNDRIKESGTWEIDAKSQVITFRAHEPNNSRKYKYTFEGYQMVLFTIQGEEKLRLEKR